MTAAALQSALEIAQIHAKRLTYSWEKLSSIFPITADRVTSLTDEEFLYLELLTSRFAKLHDFMGAKLFTLFLESQGELADEMTFLDKIHKLEKLNIIEKADDWMKMRQVRNHLSHEYPHQPQVTAEYLNQAYGMVFQLIDCLDKIAAL
jgi:hypothetical protein